jgi:hypothetical protein
MPQDKAVLSIWIIYDHPSDFPDSFVARRWEIRDEGVPTAEVLRADHLWTLQRYLASRGLVPLSHSILPEDDPVIVEVWI